MYFFVSQNMKVIYRISNEWEKILVICIQHLLPSSTVSNEGEYNIIYMLDFKDIPYSVGK